MLANSYLKLFFLIITVFLSGICTHSFFKEKRHPGSGHARLKKRILRNGTVLFNGIVRMNGEAMTVKNSEVWVNGDLHFVRQLPGGSFYSEIIQYKSGYRPTRKELDNKPGVIAAKARAEKGTTSLAHVRSAGIAN